MKLTNIEALHISMRGLNLSTDVFDYTFNSVASAVIFDTTTKPYSLIFLKKGTVDILELEIEKGYNLYIKPGEQFNAFWRFFNLGKIGTGKFKMNDFYVHLNQNIPTNTVKDPNKRVVVNSYYKMDGDPETYVYGNGLINWTKIHAQNPERNPKKGHRSLENLEKTKKLIPELYELIKDKDISVKYTNKPTKEDKIIEQAKGEK